MGQHRTNLIINISRWIRRVPIIPILCMSPLFIFGIFGPLLYLHDPHLINVDIAFQPPAWIAGGSWAYPLGTDQLGRDLLSRLIEGARASLIVGLLSVFLAGFIGVAAGIFSGFLGGKLDNLIMRVVDTWMAIPHIFFMLLVVAALRRAGVTGLLPIIISISLSMWVPYSRMIRGEVISLKERDFISLARISGASNIRIMVKHLLPNVMNTIVVMSTLQFGGAILAEAGLSFLGVGIQPPDTAWGLLVSESNKYMHSGVWWIPTFAGALIMLTILGSNLFGDWLREALDPKTRQTMK